METIKLNETDLKLLIEKIVNERYGVPDNITQTSEQILKGIITFLNSDKKHDAAIEVNFVIKDNFEISDFKFDFMRILITIKKISKYDNIGINGAVSNTTFKLVDGFKLKQLEYSTDNNYLEIILTAQNNFPITYGILSYVFNSASNYIKNVITHELKHQFDNIKNPINKALAKSDYSSYISNLNKSIPPINNFVMALYYTHDLENLVRNSELYSELVQDNITEPEFRTFLENSDTYKTLVKYKYLTIDNIIFEIKNSYMSTVNEFLLFKNTENLEQMTDVQKIKEIFKILYIAIKDSKLKQLRNYMANVLKDQLTLISQNQKYYNKELRRLDNMDIMEYFYNKQIEINKNADKTLIKLSKLYGMYKDSPIIRERIVEPTRPNAPRISLEEIRKNMVD